MRRRSKIKSFEVGANGFVRLTWWVGTTTPETTWSSTFRWRSAPPWWRGACWSSENWWVRSSPTPSTPSDGPPITSSRPRRFPALFSLRSATLLPTTTAGSAPKIWTRRELLMPSASSFPAPKYRLRSPPLWPPPPLCLGPLIEGTPPGFSKGLEWWVHVSSSLCHFFPDKLLNEVVTLWLRVRGRFKNLNALNNHRI